MKLTTTLAPTLEQTNAATSCGLRPLAKKLAFVPSLLVAGSLGAQAAESAPASATPAADGPKPAGSVELPAVTVETSTQPVLSSPKFTAPLVDTPQTVVVVPRAVFEQQGAATLSDVLRNTPGITFTAGEGGNVASGDTFTMRGFDTSGNIFVDGVRNSTAASRDVYNVEQVEIAKGPAGADAGRGGTSGYVNLVTKTPQSADFTRGTVSYGVSEKAGEDQRRANLDVNKSLDRLLPGAAFRLNLVGQDSGTPGRDEIESETWGISPSLALGLGSPTRLIVAASYDHQNNLPDSGVPAAAASEGLFRDPAGASTVLVPASSPIAGDILGNYYGLADEDYEHVIQRSLLARVEHDLTPDLKISNQTKVSDARRDAVTSFIQNGTSYDPGTNLVTPRRIRNQTDNSILSNHTNFTATFETGFVEHTLSTGLELTRESQFSPTFTAVNGPATDANNPDPTRPASPAQTPSRAANNPFTQAHIDTAAVYAFDTLKLHEKLLLNLSGRLEYYDSEFASLAAPSLAAPVPSVVRMNADGTLFTWKTGLVFKPRPEGSLYVAYGNSFTPPGSNFTFSTTPGNANDPALDPQEAVNYEAGVKWEFFDRRLSANLAVFRSVNSNVATNIGTASAPVIVYDTEQRTEGVEFGLSGKITPEWLVFGGVGFLDTKIDSPNTAATNGSELRFTPRLSGSIFTTYALTKRLTVGGGAQYTDTVTRSNNSTVAGSSTNATDSFVVLGAPDYWIFNALAAYAVNDRLTLRLNVNNVFDEESYRVNNNGGRLYPGATRTYVLSADFSF